MNPKTPRSRRSRPWLVATGCGAFALVAALAGCGSDDPELGVSDGWARPSPPGAEAAAFYLRIENNSGAEEELLTASSARCTRTEIHVSQLVDDVMQMAPAPPELLVIPADGGLTLEPDALHVMCIGVTAPLEDGDDVELELEFREAGVVSVPVDVEDR